MIGAHFQSAVRDWPDAIKLLPAGTWCKVVYDQHMCRDIKAVNPGVKVVFRYIDSPQTPSRDYEECKAIARRFFAKWIDGTFWEQQLHKYMDAVEEWNEYLANSQDAQERQMWLTWCKAVNSVWTNEYRNKYPELSHIRLVSCNTAIGNDIPVEFASVVAEHDGILSYHNYTSVLGKTIRSDDWQYYSGRWTVMDDVYRSVGVYVRWLFTEGGPTAIGMYDGKWYGGVMEGWRHKASYNGDLQAYIDGTIHYQLDYMANWNKAHSNRCLGGVLFTTFNQNGWDYFKLYTSELKKIFAVVAEYDGPVDPPPIDPPPVDKPKDKAWMSKVWAATAAYQELHGVQLNAAAGLQQRIVTDFNIPADMGVIVHNEMPFRDADGYYRVQTVESYDGKLRTVYVYESGKPIWSFNKTDFQV